MQINYQYRDRKLTILQGDITKEKVDVIVNAANTSLLGGGGVDGAIHRAAGPRLLEECRSIRNRRGSCPPGDAVITRSGNLKSQWVVHAVGPVWNGGNKQESDLLTCVYRKSLELAEEKQVSNISFPAISTGIYRFPKEKACELAVTTVLHYFDENPQSTIRDIRFVLFDFESYKLYRDLLNRQNIVTRPENKEINENYSCPICHKFNHCSNESIDTCWCRKEVFPSEIFDLLPTESLQKTCICKSCLESFLASKNILK